MSLNTEMGLHSYQPGWQREVMLSMLTALTPSGPRCEARDGLKVILPSSPSGVEAHPPCVPNHLSACAILNLRQRSAGAEELWVWAAVQGRGRQVLARVCLLSATQPQLPSPLACLLESKHSGSHFQHLPQAGVRRWGSFPGKGSGGRRGGKWKVRPRVKTDTGQSIDPVPRKIILKHLLPQQGCLSQKDGCYSGLHAAGERLVA